MAGLGGRAGEKEARFAAPGPEAEMIGGDPSSELSSNRTAMSFQRTAMSTDRTLMSVIRTSLSLISFGFTIYEAFRSFREQLGAEGIPSEAPKRFGLALILFGILLLVLGLVNHWQETRGLRGRRDRLFALGILHHGTKVRVSSAAAIAILLLLLGLFAVARIAAGVGPLE